MVRRALFISIIIVVASAVGLWLVMNTSRPIDYNTQVKPILNKRCITCHGGVKRESDFSLLFRKDALLKAKSGKAAIIPGDAEHSELVRRINESDPEERMPYKKGPLTPDEIKILTQWIKQGAQWGDHWAYTKVEQQKLPPATSWTKNDIDRFIIQKMD